MRGNHEQTSKKKNLTKPSSESLFTPVLMCINLFHLFAPNEQYWGFFQAAAEPVLLNPKQDTTTESCQGTNPVDFCFSDHKKPPWPHKICSQKYFLRVSVQDFPVSQDSESNGAISWINKPLCQLNKQYPIKFSSLLAPFLFRRWFKGQYTFQN